MLRVDAGLLGDPQRLAAVERLRPAMAAGSTLLDAIAATAARAVGAPRAVISLVADGSEQVVGAYGPQSRAEIGAHVIGVARCVNVPDMPDRQGVRAFLGVPLPDADRHPVGCLAVLDTRPRPWSSRDESLLCEMAHLLHPDVLATLAAPIGTDSFLTALLDSLNVGVIACDVHGNVVLVNRALRETQALDPASQALDQYAETAEPSLRHPDMTPMGWQQTPLMRALRGEHVQDSEVLIDASGERLRRFATTAQPIVGGEGRRLGAVAVAHEVTAIRRAEQFRECHRAVATVLSAAQSPQQAAPEVLRAVAGTLRWPLAELLLVEEGTELLRSIGHWSAPGVYAGELVGRTVAKGTGISGRVWATGRPIWIPDITDVREDMPKPTFEGFTSLGIRTVLAVPVLDGGTTLGVLACYSDAPEHNENLLTVLLEGVAAQFGVFVAMIRAGSLRHQLDRATDDYIGLVGHEMRTPLTSIAAYASMLSEDAETLDPAHRQMLAVIQRNTTALQGIVDVLLDLAGLDSGHIGLTIRPINLVDVVTEALTAAAPHAAERHVELRAQLPDGLLMSGDPDRLRQVLDDLLSNAVKYSERGGVVQVELTEDGMVDLCIDDCGIGVPEDESGLVFDRFFRGSNVRHQGTTGSGLGLSLARALVEAHGGTITFASRRPSGSRVRVRLPRRPAP